MDMELSFTEIRVLGCLMEKERTTPEYYPLTLNGLLAACNQKSNRDPVVAFDEEAVIDAVDALREKQCAFRVDVAGSRVPKYRHSIDRVVACGRAELALLCTLFLRGPQTPGELRTRSERLYPFASIPEVLETLEALKSNSEGPLVVELPRQPGRKEARYIHCWAPIPEDASGGQSDPLRVVAAPARFSREEGDALKLEIAALRDLLEGMEARLAQQETELKRLRSEWEG